MAGRIKVGTILIKEGTILPESLQLESEPYLKGWRLVRNLDSTGMDRKLCEASWTFFFMAGDVNATAVGSDSNKMTRRAVRAVLAGVKAHKSNCLEIAKVAAKRFLGLPYVMVSAHLRHIRKSIVLLHNRRAEEMGPSPISPCLNLSTGLARKAIVSEKNGDKARFGRLRKRRILERKGARELRKALEGKMLREEAVEPKTKDNRPLSLAVAAIGG